MGKLVVTNLMPVSPLNGETSSSNRLGGWLRSFLRILRRGRNGEGSVRDTLEELIEELDEADQPINDDERLLLVNILELRNRTVHDVMVPRADIVAVGSDTSLSDVIDIITSEGHSRLPVCGGL